MKTFEISSLPALQDLAKFIVETYSEERCFLFFGEMGTGKTTLIKYICAELGIEEHTSSPTYSIVNEYVSGEKRVFHFDLYRLKNQEELLDIGFEEYVYSDAFLFIEWPELSLDFIDEFIAIKIKKLEEQVRSFEILKEKNN